MPSATLPSAVLELDSVDFVRSERLLLDAITMRVNAGEHWALLGPNGAGKSTLLNLCGAVNHPTRGTVKVLGQQLGRVDMRELRGLIGFVNPRHPLRSNLGIEQIILTGVTGTIETVPRWAPTEDNVDHAHELMKLLGIDQTPTSGWMTLSQGERGRTLIARALMNDPDLLLLDEPSAGLDVAAREQLLTTLDSIQAAKPALATVLVTHHLEELPTSTTHALLLRAGRTTASGPVDEVITSDNISACFDHPIHIERRHGRWLATTPHFDLFD